MNEKSKVITTGPPVSGMFAPDQENLVEPDSHAELDYERCVQCGYCRLVCRVYNTTYAERDYAGGRNRILKSLAHGEIDFDKEKIIDAIYQCMLCGACRTVCPNGIDTLEVFQTYRHTAVKKGVMPGKLAVLRNSIVTNKNPFLESGTDRFNWCDSQSCNEGHMAYERAVEHKRKIESGERHVQRTK